MTFPLVAIGASAGGLEAVSELLSALPPKGAAAYVVIQHLDPEHKSLLAELLARKTALPVQQITDGLSVEPAHVYVLPPNATVTLNGERLHLAPREREGRHHPVDRFFTSLAEAWGDAAVAVVLSGGDADGSLGVQAIKSAGGITFAQTPQSARFPGMPQHAIDTDCVDFVLTPREIAAELGRLEQHPYLRKHLPEPERHEPTESPPGTDEEVTLRRIFRRLRAAHGVDFSHYKPSTLRRRIARRMALRKVEELTDYVAMLEDDPSEAAALYQDFLIRVTRFFRDPQAFECLREQVFPSLIEGRSRKEPLRIWVPGCATGEEVYSLAIALNEYLGERIGAFPIQIFGTDVSEVAIERARTASYLDTIGEDVSEERLKRFFVKEDKHYRIDKSLRDLCIFARQDIARDPPFSRLDLVSCRNTLIYLGAAAQRRVMQVFHYALKPKGFLLLGPSESVGAATDLFELLDKHSRLYSRRAGAPHPTGLELSEARATSARAPESAEEKASEISEADSAQREADRLLLARFAPASLVVDEALNILQVRGETGPYLEFASGAPSLNLQRVVRPPLLVELAPAIQEARESGAEVRREGVSIDREREIALVVIPLKRWSAERCFLILFDDGGRPARGRQAFDTVPSIPESEKDQRIAQLERELAATRDYLQATMEEHESSKEELKSAHEEVLSANEEFQSTNEELETAKEELQSTNEELTTTNEELRSRNRELTDLNLTVQRSRESAERARAYADAIINTVIEPLVVLDASLKVLRANQSFYEDFELKRESEGLPLVELDEGQWNQPPLLEALHAVLTQNQALAGFELAYNVPKRGLRTLRVNAHKIPADAERAELILLAVEDVTERRVGARRLKEADQRKDEFLAMLAHELRNPLTPITHAVHILRHREAATDPAPLYALIDRQIHRLVHLVDDLLDVARITRGHIQLQCEVVDLTVLVRNVIEACRARLEDRRHTLTVELSAGPLEVDADPLRLEQVISNLLENAIKYTEPGGRIAVSVNAERREAALRIRDSGVGLSPEDQESIFELFTQVDTSLARSSGGLGIGLTVARRLVMLHGGRIEVVSAGRGRGSEFIVHLPRRPEVVHPTKSGGESSSARAVASASPRRILIVDDNTDSAESLAQLVRSWGHEVATARDGPAALASAERLKPDIGLLDIGLPGMNGYELARRLRDGARNRPLLLVAMTGYGRVEDREAALSAGFDEHLVKPAHIEALQALLAEGPKQR